MTKIITRLIALGILIALCVFFMIVSVLLINQRSLQDGYLINIAGKERMLTQKITKEIFALNAQNQKSYTALDEAILEFETNLKILRFGDETKNIKSPRKDTIIKKLDSINNQWQDFKADVESFKKDSIKLYDDKKFLDENNSKMLQLSDAIVKAMVAKNLSAKLIDDSGRQRMLTQRMGYLLIRYANKWEEQAYKEFKKSYNLYDSIILNFYNSAKLMEDKDINKAITDTYRFWQAYKNHIENVLNTQENLVSTMKNITQKNTALLSEIDWMVNLYSDISIYSRKYLEKFQYGASAIMLLLALCSLYNLFKINKHLKGFVHKTKQLASGEIKENLAQAIKLDGESELSLASLNLSLFLEKIEKTQETSKEAIKLSETISEEVANITQEIKQKLESANLSESKKKSIKNTIDLSEDIAIQSSEQLITAARLLEKLHRILKEMQT